jgi:hypothetical protein
MPQIVPGLVYVPPGFLLTGVNYDDPSDYYTASGVLSATLAGQYTAVFTLKDNSNYQWMNGSTAPLSLVWTIGAATLSPSSAVLRANDIVYGNSIDWSIGVTDPEFLTWFSPAGTIFEYSTDDNIWTTVEPADAGTYYMRVIFTQSVGGDFADFMTNTVRFTISPIAVDMPTIIPGFVYDGSTEYEGIDYDEFSTLYALVPGSVVSAKNAGSYRAVFTLDDKNYMWSDGTTADLELIWTIGFNAVPDTFSATLSADDTIYGTPFAAEVKMLGGFMESFEPKEIISQYSRDGMTWTVTVPTDAGTYYMRVVFTQSAGSAYPDYITNVVQFEIGPKALVDELRPVAGTFVYNGLPQTPAAVVIGGLVAGVDYDVSYSNNTRTGEATLTITGKGNYTGTLSEKFTVSPKQVTVIPVSGHSKIAGEEDPALAYAVSGLVGHDNLSGALVREPGEDPGEYLIRLGSLSHSDYTILFTDGVVFIVEEKIDHNPYASAYWLLFMFGFLAGAMIARYVWRRLYGEG